jgi:uncharacterized protein
MIVSQLYIYPLKSCQGIELKQAEVRATGLLWDREMMLVNQSGKFITQRQYPHLAKVRVEIIEQNITLTVEDESTSSLTFTPTLIGAEIAVEIWADHIIGIDQGDEVAQWFHRVLNFDPTKQCRLVRQSPQNLRSLNLKYVNDPQQPVSFADNYPVMITATASLEELNQRIVEIHQQEKQAIPMNRFRPNIVIETTEPFIEDNWSLIQIGTVKFIVVKPCSRCIITTIDQKRGEKNQFKEPLGTLGTFRQFSEQGVLFGENMIPQNTGIIRIGDRLEVLKTRKTS